MSWMRKHKGSTLRLPGAANGRRLAAVTGLLVLLALLVAACGGAAEPTAAPAAEPTALPAPTETQAAEPTAPPEPTAAPTAEPTSPPPTAAPTAEPTSPPPTEAPAADETITPAVTIADQAIVDEAVTAAEVVSDGPGWLVIHAQADGSPGPVLGYSPVADGTNSGVRVEIDVTKATGTLYAMLHTDAGQVGSYEFPGDDGPVRVAEQVVTPAFAITGGLPAAEPAVTPSVTVADQTIVDGTVIVAKVVSDGPGWIVIHADNGSQPGAILGYTPVADGTNRNLAVPIDLSSATSRLHAMLHTDGGTVGAWEFPGGQDTPVMFNDQMVSPTFNLAVLPGDEAEVEIEDFLFQPQVLVIRVGTTVKWSNKDDIVHTATSDTGVWDSGNLAKGDDFFFTFTEPGLYPYYCIPHGGPGGQGMSATVIVVK